MYIMSDAFLKEIKVCVCVECKAKECAGCFVEVYMLKTASLTS